MHPGIRNKRLAAACDAIAENAQQIADRSGATFTPPDSYRDLRQNLAAPVETQLLVLAELVAAALGLLVEAQPIVE